MSKFILVLFLNILIASDIRLYIPVDYLVPGKEYVLVLSYDGPSDEISLQHNYSAYVTITQVLPSSGSCIFNNYSLACTVPGPVTVRVKISLSSDIPCNTRFFTFTLKSSEQEVNQLAPILRNPCPEPPIVYKRWFSIWNRG